MHSSSLAAPLQVLMEYSFVWSSKLEVKLLVKLLGKWQGTKGLRSMLSSVTRLKARKGAAQS